MKRLLALSVICLIINCLFAQKPLSLASSFYNTLNNYVLYNDHIEYQKLMNMCDEGFRVSDRFAQEQTDIPSPSLLLQNYLELLRDKQVKLAITDMREITLSNHRTEGVPTKTVLVNVTLSSSQISTYKLQNVVYIRNNKIFCVGDYEVDKSGKVLTDVVNKTNRTSTNNNIHNGHEYVDLGLSVMWATCNVGASTPEEYGDYFAWGETTPKELYDWSTYKHYYEEYDLIVKYYNNYKNVLDLSDDAAHVNWGGKWRIPTEAEWTELVENCTVKREISIQLPDGLGQVGYGGIKFISKINGNSIILPFAGGAVMRELDDVRINGFYWSSTLYSDDSTKAWGLYVDSSGGGVAILLRAYGQSIRPVFSPYH